MLTIRPGARFIAGATACGSRRRRDVDGRWRSTRRRDAERAPDLTQDAAGVAASMHLPRGAPARRRKL
jgi:hypothetical protein